MPYCLQRLKNKDVFVILNRYYKPLGIKTDASIDYDKYPTIIHRLTEKKLAQMVITNPSINEKSYYFYGDGCKPWQSNKLYDEYMERVKILFKLNINYEHDPSKW